MGLALTAALTLTAPGQAAILGPFEAVRLRLAQLAVAIAAPAPAISPAAPATPATTAPRPTPTPRHYVLRRGGRLQFSLSGSLSLGARSTSQTVSGGGFFPSASPSPGPTPNLSLTTTQALSQGSLGMLADVSRRTALSSLDLRLPLGFATNSRVGLGQIALLYSTSRYALGYGPQSVSVFGQLNVGSTLRGEYAIVPVSEGDVTLMMGPTIGAQGEQIPLKGMRWRHFSGRDLYELGLISANGPITGHSRTLVLGAATSRRSLTAIAETAFQERTGGDNAPHGFTYQARVDDGSLQSYATVISRHVAPGFVAFGAGEIYGDNYWDVGFHRNTSAQSFAFDTSSERYATSSVNAFTTSRVSTLNYGGPLRFGTYSLTLQSNRVSASGASTQWQGSLNTQLSATVGSGFLLMSSVLSRSTQSAANGNSATTGYNVSLQQPLHALYAGVSLTSFRQMTQLAGPTTQTSTSINVTRQYIKTGYSIAETFGHTVGDLSNALTRTTQLSVSRQISPALSVQANYLIQSLRDRLNPAANGRSHSFSIQVNAPFTFGNGLVSGPPDPRLPATIAGRVLTDTSSNPTFAGLISAGVSNVQVVLDNKVVQRTDVTGGFQFSFVSPGQHQIRIESASLPRGVTVDIPVYSVNVEGGQTAQISFLVGDFGGIQGHVYGTNDRGEIVPLPHVMLRVDGGVYSQTDLTGAYGFGRLHPGKHVVTVIENSVPAFATFDPKKAKAVVTVRNGVVTQLNFDAEPLGSISGSVLFDNQEGPDSGDGVLNAYVVAEPGEHAAIVNEDGSYIIDDLPLGDYTLSVDNETIPEGLGAAPDSLAVTLGPQEHYKGAAFLVGHMQKKVVFSFVGDGAQAASASVAHVRVSEARLPPRGTATIRVDAPKSAGRVTAAVFGHDVQLVYDDRASAWVGTLVVPTNVKAGTYPVTATVAHGTAPSGSRITVDPKMPIVIVHIDPANPQPGQYVRVRARFLVDVHAGDRIEWQDGQVTTLGKPVSGRVFTFSLRISLRPLHGLLLTKGSRLPISLM